MLQKSKHASFIPSFVRWKSKVMVSTLHFGKLFSLKFTLDIFRQTQQVIVRGICQYYTEFQTQSFTSKLGFNFSSCECHIGSNQSLNVSMHFLILVQAHCGLQTLKSSFSTEVSQSLNQGLEVSARLFLLLFLRFANCMQNSYFYNHTVPFTQRFQNVQFQSSFINKYHAIS